jgi:hypothetical protein
LLSVTDRQRRWLTAVLVLGAIVLAMVAIELAATVFFAFGDVILVFFLAWLLAFILSPVVAGLTRLVPILPRIGAVVLVYATLVGAIFTRSISSPRPRASSTTWPTTRSSSPARSSSLPSRASARSATSSSS